MVAGLPFVSAPGPERPHYHFTAGSGWLNDPNGLTFFKGEYHLFFQHNPSGVEWGNMTWGHAVSRDLVHWKQVENALTPDNLGTMFSGSGVVDKKGTAGFGPGALLLLYTAAGGTNPESQGKAFSQCLAWSLDGRSFTKFEGNPVLPHLEAENRDPKVIWHEPSKKWVMALYLQGDHYALFGSSDLKSWAKLSDVVMPGTGECPDFFPLSLEGDRKTVFWVFSGANGNYRLGSFDGTHFKPIGAVEKSNFGPNSYAAQTFFNDPKGRRIQIAWMNGSDFKGAGWNQQMSLPRQLTIRNTPMGAKLFTQPAPEVKALRARKLRAVGPLNGATRTFATSTGLIEVDAELEVPRQGSFAISLGQHTVIIDASKSEVSVDQTKVHLDLTKRTVSLRVFFDKGSIEAFVQDGLVSIPEFALFGPEDLTLSITQSGEWKARRMNVYELKGALAR